MRDYEKLKQIIDEIPKLISANVSSSDPLFQAWKTKAERFLMQKYGKNSYEYTHFQKTSFSLYVFTSGTPNSAFVEACQDGLRTSQAIFQTYLDEMSDTSITTPIHQTGLSKIFIVHGHDGELKEAVARIIEKQNIEAVILGEKANQGRTIIEKFENYSDVAGAICLFTADDVGSEKNNTSMKSRARQNVVFETGYFMGKLGRDHVLLLADNNVEMPSDLSGVVYTNAQNWQVDLLKDLKAMGYDVDFNKLF